MDGGYDRSRCSSRVSKSLFSSRAAILTVVNQSKALVGRKDCHMLVAIKFYVKGTAIRLTVEECMEVTHWDGILTAAGKMGVDRSMRLFRRLGICFLLWSCLKRNLLRRLFYLHIIPLKLSQFPSEVILHTNVCIFCSPRNIK